MKRLCEKIYLKDILKKWDDPKYEMVYDTDYYNRDNAFAIYNDEVYEASTHEQALRKAGFSYGGSENYSSILGSILTGTDGKQYVAIYKSSAENMTVDEAINILKAKYPNAIICFDPMNDIDETAYLETVAKLKRGGCMKRLVKKSMMTPEMFEGTIEQLGDKGRAILKLIEEYKFDLEQAGRIVSNNQILSQKLVQKKSEVDKAAGQIYTIVFDIENIDIVSAFEQQEQMVNNPGMAGPLDGEMPNIPNKPEQPTAPTPGQPAEDAATPPIGGGAPSTPPPTTEQPEENSEEKPAEEEKKPEDSSEEEEKK